MITYLFVLFQYAKSIKTLIQLSYQYSKVRYSNFQHFKSKKERILLRQTFKFISNNNKFQIEKRTPMFFSTQNLNLQKMIQQFFESRSYLSVPMTQQFNMIQRWIKHYRNDQENQVNLIIESVEEKLRKLQFRKQESGNPQWLVILKSMMMIHHLLCMAINGNIFESVLQTVNQSLHKLQKFDVSLIDTLNKKLLCKQNNHNLEQSLKSATFQHTTIYQKLLQPYHHYLTRRCQMLPKSFTQQHKVHYLVNLMTTACNCNEVIYILARYKNFDAFGVGREVNLLLAKDVGMLYDLLRTYLREGQSFPKQNMQYDIEQSYLRVQDIDDILLQLHQNLFHIFYNKYHYVQTDPYVPNWIDLETHYQNSKKLKPSKTPQKSLLSRSSKKDSSIMEETRASISFSFKGTKCIDESTLEKSLELIGDLEKFLETFDQVMV